MPYPFALPTTCAIRFDDFYSSPTHPSLLLNATTHRAVVRNTLKKHKRLLPQQQASDLPAVKNSLEAYIPYLVLLLATLQGSNSYNIELTVTRELETQWRSTLSPTIAGREPSRTKVIGLTAEYLFALQTLAYTYTQLARSSLLSIHASTALTTEQRTAHIASATRSLLTAQSIHKLIASTPATPTGPIDIQPSTASALSSLALAEATLLVVSKDDPYPAAVAKLRDETSKDWMVSAPTIPKVRAHLFARICLAAADAATLARGLLASAGIDPSVAGYVDDLRRTARARAVRFLGVDADLAGETGTGIAYVRAGKRELGLSAGEEGRKRGFRALKHSFSERREDARISGKSGQGWGMDAGRLEEGRVLLWLEEKWVKSNDTVNVQVVPPLEPLMASLPSGRDYLSPKVYEPPSLDTRALEGMRRPPSDQEQRLAREEVDSDDEAGLASHLDSLNIRAQSSRANDPIGAFPGTGARYGASDDGYY